MWNEESVLAVVPARGGSKGVPRKNLRQVGGVSLVAWTAATVRALPWIDHALLSTDDAEIAEEGVRHGLDAPFMRPAELATDTATGVAVWRHAWEQAEQLLGRRFELSVYLQPTTPRRTSEEVTLTLRTLVEGGHAAATIIAPVPGHFVPEKQLALDERGCVQPWLPGTSLLSNRQDARPSYWRTGACYAARRHTILTLGHITEEDCAGVLTDALAVNIDTLDDLELADLLARRLRRG